MHEAAARILESARAQVRKRTRSAGYFSSADRFSDLLLDVPFGAPALYSRALVTDLTCIDVVYEAAGASALKSATRRLQEATDLDAARRLLPVLGAGLSSSSCDLVEVARAILAVVTVLGTEAAAAEVSPEHAAGWSLLWRRCVRAHNAQQERIGGLGLVAQRAPGEPRAAMEAWAITGDGGRCQGRSFADGVHHYLEQYGETSGVSFAIAGCLPFAQKLSRAARIEVLRALEAPSGLLPLIARLLRFAQDLTLDPTEPISAGVAGHAAERRKRLIDVRHADIPRDQVLEQLAAEWTTYLAGCRVRMDDILQGVAEESAREALRRLTRSVLSVAGAVSTGAYKAGLSRVAGSAL